MLIDREAPGMAEAMRAESSRHLDRGWLSRGVVGTRGRTLIVNFPGNPPAIEQAGAALARRSRTPVRLLSGGEHPHLTAAGWSRPWRGSAITGGGANRPLLVPLHQLRPAERRPLRADHETRRRPRASAPTRATSGPTTSADTRPGSSSWSHDGASATAPSTSPCRPASASGCRASRPRCAPR